MIHHWQQLLRNLQSQKFDINIDLRGQLQTGLMSLATGVPIRSGLETACESSSYTYTDLIHNSRPLVPEFVRYWRVAESPGVGDLLHQADCLLANDAGPLHLAASLGTSVVSLCTCTSPQIPGHPGAGHELESSCVDCHASNRKRCPRRGSRHLACMEELYY